MTGLPSASSCNPSFTWIFSFPKSWISGCTWWAPPEIHEISPWAQLKSSFFHEVHAFWSNHKERPPEWSFENGNPEKLSYESLAGNAHTEKLKAWRISPRTQKKCFNFSCQSDAYGVRQSATHAQKYLWPILLLGNRNGLPLLQSHHNKTLPQGPMNSAAVWGTK